MTKLGYIVCAIGLVGTVLSFTSFDQSIPLLANLNVPMYVWIGMAVVGGLVAMLTRQTRD